MAKPLSAPPGGYRHALTKRREARDRDTRDYLRRLELLRLVRYDIEAARRQFEREDERNEFAGLIARNRYPTE